MDKKSKIFFIVFGLLIAISVAVTYWRIMVKRDYVIESQVDCDPYTEACFVWECNPASKVEGEACTGTEDDIWYYKIARRNAGRIPLCDPNTDENCQPMLCEPGETDCSETLCDETNKIEQGVECNDPVKYTEENPMEEEGAVDLPADEAECAEGDTECEAAPAIEETGSSVEGADLLPNETEGIEVE